jgi:hypothetical protein
MKTARATKPKRQTDKDVAWQISRIKGTPAAHIGRVMAPTAEAAIAKAIEQYKVRPEVQDRLVARRVS